MKKESIDPGLDPAYLLREEMGKSMPIDIWYNGDIWVFRPRGRIDAGNAVDLDTALTLGIEQGMSRIILDLSDTTYIASSGMRAVTKAGKAVKPDNGSITICGMSEQVSEVFRLTGLSTIFSIYKTSDDAISSLQKSGENRKKSE